MMKISKKLVERCTAFLNILLKDKVESELVSLGVSWPSVNAEHFTWSISTTAMRTVMESLIEQNWQRTDTTKNKSVKWQTWTHPEIKGGQVRLIQRYAGGYYLTLRQYQMS